MPEMIRSFIAIPLSPEIRNRIAEFYTKTNLIQNKSIRIVRPEIIHITLKFLGEVTTTSLVSVKQELTDVVQTISSFNIGFRGLGAFPGWRNPRVLWIGVKAPPILTELAGKIDSRLGKLGFSSEARGFSPHLTIGRINQRTGQVIDLGHLEKLQDSDFGNMNVTCVTLYRSDLRPAGPIYTPLSTHTFGSKVV